MKILLLGSGGREHALAWKIAQSPQLTKLYIAPGNAGTVNAGENIDLKATDFEGNFYVTPLGRMGDDFSYYTIVFYEYE